MRTPWLWGGQKPTASELQIDDLILWLTLGIIVGGRLGYVLFYMLPLHESRVMLAANPLEILEVWHGGMSFHGGAIGVTVAITCFALARRISLLGLADIVAACVPLGLLFGRIANFINGELWGRETTAPWGVVFCSKYIPTDAAGNCIAGLHARHPSQLYEAGLEGLFLFLILRLATHGFLLLHRRGVVTGLFLAFYGLFRISLENVRVPDAGLQHLPLGLTMGMILSAPMVVVGLGLVWTGLRAPLVRPPAYESY